MNKEFITLYDDNGYIYIVNINSVSFIEVERQKVWVGNSLLELSQNSINRLLKMLLGDSE